MTKLTEVECKSYPTISVKTNIDDVTYHTEWTGRAVVPHLKIQAPRPAISYINWHLLSHEFSPFNQVPQQYLTWTIKHILPPASAPQLSRDNSADGGGPVQNSGTQGLTTLQMFLCFSVVSLYSAIGGQSDLAWRFLACPTPCREGQKKFFHQGLNPFSATLHKKSAPHCAFTGLIALHFSYLISVSKCRTPVSKQTSHSLKYFPMHEKARHKYWQFFFKYFLSTLEMNG